MYISYINTVLLLSYERYIGQFFQSFIIYVITLSYHSMGITFFLLTISPCPRKRKTSGPYYMSISDSISWRLLDKLGMYMRDF